MEGKGEMQEKKVTLKRFKEERIQEVYKSRRKRVKGVVRSKMKLCCFTSCMTDFLQWNTKENVWKNVHTAFFD